MFRQSLRFHTTIFSIVLLAVTATCALFTLVAMQVSSETAERVAYSTFSEKLHDTYNEIDGIMRGGIAAVEVGASLDWSATDTHQSNPLHYPHLQAIQEMLDHNPDLHSIYAGFHDGLYLQVKNLRDSAFLHKRYDAPDAARKMLQVIQSGRNGKRITHRYFFDAYGARVDVPQIKPITYDPRVRPWFKQALAKNGLTLARPYVFNGTKSYGLTLAKPSQDGRAVFASDITTEDLQRFISNLEITEHSNVYVLGEGVIFAHSTHQSFATAAEGEKFIRSSLEHVRGKNTQGRVAQFMLNDEPYLISNLLWVGPDDRRVSIGVFAPVSDFTGHFDQLIQKIVIVGVAVTLFLAPLVMWYCRNTYKVVDGLREDAKKLRAFDFTSNSERNFSYIQEFQELTDTFDLVRRSLKQRGEALQDAQDKLEHLVQVGVALSAEKDEAHIFETAMRAARNMTGADTSAIALLDEDEKSLILELVYSDMLDIHYGGTSDRPSDLPPIQLHQANPSEFGLTPASHALFTGKTVLVDDVYSDERFDFCSVHHFDQVLNYKTYSLLVVPLVPRGGNAVGVMILSNIVDPSSGQCRPFDPENIPFVETLAAQAAVALQNRKLFDDQSLMVDSMVSMIAAAIDTKSPYTGAHCARVPELARMMAEAASNSDEAPFKDFAFSTPEQWREFSLGALLHDCGKLTTPEYVIDKATKLETVNNRIHEIRTRFEVLWRDAEITYLKACLAGQDILEALQVCKDTQGRLVDDFAFLAHSNVGTEWMSDEDEARLRTIAQTPWLRHFDNQLGLSHTELARLNTIDKPQLPVTETLLMDRPEHEYLRGEAEALFASQYGFKQQTLKNRLHLGELHNLSIRRGTLSDEERVIVNEHIIHTIVMLERLKLPKNLQRIPNYSASHHEKLNGTGYPRALGAEDLDIPSRIMAIADIFEALTAADRPYKKPKTLSEAVRILVMMAQDGEIDRDILSLFLRRGIHLEYAHHYLKAEQIDNIDVDLCLEAIAVVPLGRA